MACRETVVDDGWRLRFNDGVTRRANSVLPERAGDDALDAKLARAEAFYLRRGLDPRFQTSDASQPSALEGVLARRGYAGEVGALVQTAELTAVAPGDGTGEIRLRWHRAPTDAWLETLARGSGSDAAAMALRTAGFRAMASSTVFVSAELDGLPVSVGLGVAAGTWLGVFNMATDPGARRRGAARAVLAGIARWGKAEGVAAAYLQVHPGNAAALALYAAAGFVTHHAYRYWTAPRPGQ